MNRINPEKLNRSKWTAVTPRNQQKHFIVTGLVRDVNERIVQCELEAVINREVFTIDWQELKQSEQWLMGWK